MRGIWKAFTLCLVLALFLLLLTVGASAAAWDSSTREASFTDGAKTIYFPIGSTTARTSDGGTVTMDTSAVIVNGRTYAPIRYLAEFFGRGVSWDGKTRTAAIG